jgi:membrane-bound lytic murein transglycosylase A
VGRVLIDRGIIPREQMSMQRIRQYFEENPEAANEVRRQNRAFVFFREVQLAAEDEAVGAQGVPLTAGRSIAVDKGLHVYGTPFFIEGELPIETEISKTPFRRLMVEQDTGSAIIGPARADLYFGAGTEMGRIAGRIKHPAKFVMLVPKSLDPSARGHDMPLPDIRPSAKIAKLFPQTPVSEPAKVEPAKTDIAKAGPPKAEAAKTEPVTEAKPAMPATTAVPLPAPKPVELAALAIPAAAATIPMPEARPASAPQLAKNAPPEAKPEAKPQRAKYKRRVHRRAPAQSSSSFFRFPWQ